MALRVMIVMLAFSILNSAGSVGLKVVHPIVPPLRPATKLASEDYVHDNKPLPYYFTEESTEQQQGSADDALEAATEAAVNRLAAVNAVALARQKLQEAQAASSQERLKEEFAQQRVRQADQAAESAMKTLRIAQVRLENIAATPLAMNEPAHNGRGEPCPLCGWAQP
mmetsp:Transcript_5091/g.12203  ORF Transcript_5091/g.12203 Transcript_5091/m.12203 type:complete len:168 (-) Transcript_5091:55-558(-)